MFKSKIFKNSLALFLITLVAGFALAMVNAITSQPISNADEKAKMKAYESVFAGAEFEHIDAVDDIVEGVAHTYQSTVNDAVLARSSNGDVIGYVISSTSHIGYGGDVTVAVGISTVDGALSGIKVISQNETAGLGARCTEDEFQAQYKGKALTYINVMHNEADADDEIDAISGATITSTAVTDAVNIAIEFYNNSLKEVEV